MKNSALIFVLLLVTTAFSQSGDIDSKLNVRVKTDKPTVYLDYVCQDKKKIYLRMFNNTIWNIDVTAYESYFPTKRPLILLNGAKVYAIPDDKEIPLQYYVQKDEMIGKKKVKIPKVVGYRTNGGGWIASQDSILFSVPMDYLQEGLKVSVNYNYEWEITKDGYTINDPEHRVYFRSGTISSANSDVIPLACKK